MRSEPGVVVVAVAGGAGDHIELLPQLRPCCGAGFSPVDADG